MDSIKIISVATAALFIICSCDKKTEYIYVDKLGKIEDPSNIDELKFSFSADIQLSSSPGITPMQTDRYAHIFAYREGVTPLTGNYYAMSVFKCETVGTLTCVSYPLTLPRGTYSLYSAGSNYIGSDQGPDFYNGISGSLAQDVDYLWWSKQDIDITSDNQIVPITYSHCCARVTINFGAIEGVTLNSLGQVNISLGNNSNAKMSLQTGDISPCTSISNSQTLMHVNGTSAEVIALPVRTSSSDGYMTSIISATVDNTFRWYTLKVPLPSGNVLSAGLSYVYTANFDGKTGYTEGSSIIAELTEVSGF